MEKEEKEERKRFVVVSYELKEHFTHAFSLKQDGSESVCSIGRSESNHVVVKCNLISQNHLEVFMQDDV